MNLSDLFRKRPRHWNDAWHPDRATHQPVILHGGPHDGERMTAARDCGGILFYGEEPAGNYRRRIEGDYNCTDYDWAPE